MSDDTLVEYSMEPIKVRATKKGYIEIAQQTGIEEGQCITIVPEQVDTVIEWLQWAKDEIQKTE